MTGTDEKQAYRIREIAAALRYAFGTSEYARTWVHVVTGPKLELRCAVRRADQAYALVLTRDDRTPDRSELDDVRQGLTWLQMEELGAPVENPSRRTVAIIVQRVRDRSRAQ